MSEQMEWVGTTFVQQILSPFDASAGVFTALQDMMRAIC